MATPVTAPDLLAAEPAVLTDASVGYARVSTHGQILDRQLLKLTEAGCIKVFADKQSGRDADRPELIACLAYLRPGDTLVVPSLDRLARSLQDLLNIVGDLRRNGVGFRSLHEAIDTTTPGGRLVFHIFAALAEFIRELIVEGTHERLAAARARGTRLGRPPAMTPDQVRSARTLLAEPDHSVTSIAKLLGVSRSTIYKYIPELRSPAMASAPAPLELPAATAADSTRDEPMPATPRANACPTCGHSPSSKHELELHREGLETVWLEPDPAQAGSVVKRWHCERCQPHQARIVMCGLCSSTVMLGGAFAAEAPAKVPDSAALWLAGHDWTDVGGQWVCGRRHE
ncbi:DNA invertase Pin-like site-specific DNA recombinase [Kribbella sp. VKM Ac-2569]|uniref:recombinase family protein n=1 Tax=Kribbella sp. VKM Ac-2569 TaxID=2512220 RepID=UPI00102BD860|nr:recombinase family protein [Kribbella sp. VKM Ac-2569]RZT17476.1 DNA invertase Pin-like site-specific DNA recombinase [Kribbella sp. VKM Ac-2569]